MAKHKGVCIYCNGPSGKVREGEHVIAQAIGGALTIVEKSGRLVCGNCNNGPLSVVDRELCNRSYLGLIASQELEATLWQIFDVDHSAGAQLVEARPSWKDGVLDNLVCYPQILFYSGGSSMRCDAAEVMEFGYENFEAVLAKATYRAFQRWNSNVKRKSLFFEQLDSGLVEQGYRYPPRVFIRNTIRKIAEDIDKQTVIVRYRSPEDKRLALRSLSDFHPHRKMTRKGTSMGTRLPAVASSFDLGITLRGLLKIGVNILATFCTKTDVSSKRFGGVMRLIRGVNHPTPDLIAMNGFVNTQYLTEINAPNRAHAFRLTHLVDGWQLYASFFGGRIGAFANFPGPNNEPWQTIDIVAPLGSKEWHVSTFGLRRPLQLRMGWNNLGQLAPTVKMRNTYSDMSFEEVEPRRKRS